MTWFAEYNAFGTAYERVGTNPDPQRANTKEEEAELGLLNEGMRYRDLATGTFLTRDPIRYGDGPNMYCYVHCNPITHFDPLGLFDNEDERKLFTSALSKISKETDFYKTDLGKEIGGMLRKLFKTENDVADKDGNYKDTIRFGELEPGKRGVYNPTQNTITLDRMYFEKLGKSAGENSSESLSALGAALCGTIVHEGMHAWQHHNGVDMSVSVPGLRSQNETNFEREAYTVGMYVQSRLNSLPYDNQATINAAITKKAIEYNFGRGAPYIATPGMISFNDHQANLWAKQQKQEQQNIIDGIDSVVYYKTFSEKENASKSRKDAVAKRDSILPEQWYAK